MRSLLTAASLSVCLVLGYSLPSHAEEAAKPGQIVAEEANLGRPVDFEKDVQPILDEKCVACHNVAIPESKLVLEDVPSILKGGKRGPAVVAKDVAKSLIYQVAARAAEPAMPPLPNKVSASSLTPQELGILKKWIEEGASAGDSAGSVTVPWQSVPANMNSIYSVALSTWGRWAACGRANQIDLYDLATGEYVTRLQDPQLLTIKQGDKQFYPHGAAHRDFVHALAFNPQENLLASAGYREVKLWQRLPNQQRGAFPQDQAVVSMSVSPDGNWVALGRADNSLILQSLKDPNTRRVLAGHTGPVTATQFSPDSTKLFSGSSDKSVRLWSVADGQQAGLLNTPHEVTSLAISPDGAKVYSGHAGDHFIRGWAVPFATAKPAEGDKPAEPVVPVVELKGHGGPVTSLAVVLPAGTQVVSASADATWRVWDATTGAQVTAPNHGAPIVSMSVRNDGQFVVTAGANNVARIWKIDGSPVAEMKGNIAAQRHILKLTDADTVAKSRVQLADASFKAAEKNFKEREEATKKAIEQKDAMEKALGEAKAKETTAVAAVEAAKTELAGKPEDEALKKKVADAEAAAAKETEAVKKAQDAFDAGVKTVAQSEKGQQSADEQQKQVKAVFDAETAAAKEVETVFNQAKADLPALEAKQMKSVAYVDGGRLIAIAGEDGVIRLWSGTTGKPLEEITGHAAGVGLVASGPGKLLVAAGDDKQVLAWDANPDWKLLATLGPADNSLGLERSQMIDRVLSVAFSPDGKLLATGGGDPSRSGELILWNVETRTIARQFPEAHSDTVCALDFSSDGKYLVSGAADKFVKQFDVATGKLVRSFEGHTHHVLGVSWKADSSRIASAGADNAIKVWNVETGEQHRTIQNYSKQVTTIQYIGASDNLISGSGDKTVKMHRSNDGGNYRNFAGSTDYVYSVAVTRDEAIAIAGGEDGVLRVWNGTNAQELYKFEPPKQPADNAQANVR
ncbi:c-type cytochrome domain-containing protein [Schlesneria sp.]|uniref:c-type cytochrome domain-containing protein n=1 Tax=Schlesneria sp. TaxID=2762018 RepID=UPI002EE0EA91